MDFVGVGMPQRAAWGHVLVAKAAVGAAACRAAAFGAVPGFGASGVGGSGVSLAGGGASLSGRFVRTPEATFRWPAHPVTAAGGKAGRGSAAIHGLPDESIDEGVSPRPADLARLSP